MNLKLVILLVLLSSICSAQPDLKDLVLVIDPGHRDRAWGRVPRDPGATTRTSETILSECIYTWDTAMRLKRLAEARGATVYLTLEADDDAPYDWNPEDVSEWRFKTLVDLPRPASEYEALLSRVSTANRMYVRHSATHDVVFLSLHYDSANSDLAGISFYYPTWCDEPLFVRTLAAQIRNEGRERRSLSTGVERGLAQAHDYAVLSQAINPDSFLVELGNIRSDDGRGGNPDLEGMLDPMTREACARMLVEALQARPKAEREPRRVPWALVAGFLLLVCLIRWCSLLRQAS